VVANHAALCRPTIHQIAAGASTIVSLKGASKNSVFDRSV
jgi:hypothetical protein